MSGLTKSAYKKDMTGPMAEKYSPLDVEAKWGDFWELEGHMSANAEDVLNDESGTESFVIVIPPPNVTGSLHLGHALTTAIEDCLVRWHRMLGHHTLWVPGTDHAGIATQSTVEKMLAKNEGITRHDLGREKFLERVWQWKEVYGSRITTQLRRLGGSVDWSREAFTMDDNLSNAVKEFFVTQHEKGIIYRENRLVNWCCHLNTALSDVEVEHVTITKRTMLPDPEGPISKLPGHEGVKCYEFGVLVNFAYKFVGGGPDEEIVVATTRIETMLGDTAVAVHPKDPRYAKAVGRQLVHPFFPDRKITVVTDGELVDMALGSGAVKITPAHDPKDFQCGKRNKLEFINIFNENGTVNGNGGEFEGIMRYDARVAVKAKLDALGLLRGQEDNEMQIPICSRSGDIIEPMLKPQWWVNCKVAAKQATDAVRDGSLKLIPDFHEHTWFRWLDNIQDWCISRQLWWGHRVPAYLVAIDGKKLDATKNESWVSGRDEVEAMAKAVAQHKVDASKITLYQDPDVLDTWFSSAIFPFSVFGWPNKTDDVKAFYPNQLLETGHDILFFWVARMVMAGFMLTDQLPFDTVYLHAMVRDAHGRKMSKSLGNVLDPIDVMEGITLEELHAKLLLGNLKESEVVKATAGQKKDFPDGISECGADALRFGLLAYTVQGRDVNLNVNKVAAYRRMCNKIWQATKFALLALGDDFVPEPLFCEEHAHELPFEDQWVLHGLNTQIKGCNQAMKDYSFGTAVNVIVQFWKKDDSSGCFCDNYIEMIKPIMRDDATCGALRQRQMRNVVWTCMEVSLRLLHPLMPFLTEELYHRLPRVEGPELIESREFSIMVAPYPQATYAWDFPEVEAQMAVLQKIFKSMRAMRTQYKYTRERPAMAIKSGISALLKAQTPLLATMGQFGTLDLIDEAGSTPADWAKTFEAGCEIAMEPPAIDYKAELAKLSKLIAPKIKSLDSLKQKMGLLLDIDERGLKKMAKNEKKLKQSCDKYGLPAGSIEEMHAKLTTLLELQLKEGSAPKTAEYVKALAAATAAVAAKMPEKVMLANEAKKNTLDEEIASLQVGIATAQKNL